VMNTAADAVTRVTSWNISGGVSPVRENIYDMRARAKKRVAKNVALPR